VLISDMGVVNIDIRTYSGTNIFIFTADRKKTVNASKSVSMRNT